MTPILRCIQCLTDTQTNPCEHCGSDQVVDRTQQHIPHWSRWTALKAACKICDRKVNYDDMSDDPCVPAKGTP